MRSVTSFLNGKLKSNEQTIHNKSNPKMSISIGRARTTVMDSDYWTVETIRKKPGLGDISLAARRRVPYGSPDRIYDIHVDNNMIKTSIREYPDYSKTGWIPQFELGTGGAVAIAFDGHWQRYRRKWRIVTEDKPFIFWVDENSILWGQLWDLDTTRIELATSVVSVKAIRGWKNVNFPDKDQGVVVAYIKTNGSVYYRNYCQTEYYTFTWETEKELIEFNSTAKSLNMFITNDYRLGFTIEDVGGKIHWLVTDRNWAGMAIASDTIKINIQKIRTELIPLEFNNAFLPAETMKILNVNIMSRLIFHGEVNKILQIKNIDDGSGDWGRVLEFETFYPLFQYYASNILLEDVEYEFMIPIESISHKGGNEYIVNISQDTLVGMNNSEGSVRLTIKNVKTELGLTINDFSIDFKPVNLLPIYIPLPTVVEVWNE